MATRNKTQSTPTDNVYLITWSGLLQSDDGDPVQQANFADRSVQIIGVFGGSTVLWEGSLDGVNYSSLTDPQGNVLSIADTHIETITELALYLRPRVIGGNGTTSLTALLLMRHTQR